MKKLILLCWFVEISLISILIHVLFFPSGLGFSTRAFSQPYIDIASVKYSISPATGLFDKDQRGALDYYNFSSTIPFRFRNKKDAFIISPSFEVWNSVTSNNATGLVREKYYGIIIPVSLLKQFSDRWNVLSTAIIRMNDSRPGPKVIKQVGGAMLIGYKKSISLTYKVGVYLNDEYSGVFVMPLTGIDWKIDDKTNLFGVLPGSLTLERRLTNKLYAGAAFRAITNSYAKSDRNLYWRIDENQLGLLSRLLPGKPFRVKC